MICEKIATTPEGLEAICASDERLPNPSTVYAWVAKHDEFHKKYTQAREAQAHLIADETREIVDDGRNDWMEKLDDDGKVIGWRFNGEAAQRSRLRFDQRRWYAGKLAPKTYGEKQTIEHSGSISVTFQGVSDDELLEELRRIIATGSVKLPAEIEALAYDATTEEPANCEGCGEPPAHCCCGLD